MATVSGEAVGFEPLGSGRDIDALTSSVFITLLFSHVADAVVQTDLQLMYHRVIKEQGGVRVSNPVTFRLASADSITSRRPCLVNKDLLFSWRGESALSTGRRDRKLLII